MRSTLLAEAGNRAGVFFAWWGRELLACLPAPLRALVVPPRSQLLIEILKGGALRFSALTPSGPETLVTTEPRSSAAEEDLQSVRALAANADGVIIALPETCGVKRRIDLPAAARENLSEVVAMEMDRLTPFKAEEVYFQVGRAWAGRTREMISLDLTVVPRTVADDAIKMSRAVGIDPDTLALGLPAGDGSNLLAIDGSPAPQTPRLLSRGFAIAAALLIAAIVAVPFLQQTRRIAALETQLTAAGSRTQADAQMRLASLGDGARRIATLHTEAPFAVALLDELSRALPKGTWLTEIDLDRQKISLAGLSDNAPALIAVLEQLPHLQAVKFDEPVAADEGRHKDRFRLSATVVGSKVLK
ncbi:MAG: PilN domain-containing protein [Alphaproteobacteria bacterium]